MADDEGYLPPVATYVRYERRGARVVPVRVTKAWLEPPEVRPGKLPLKLARRLSAVRVTELKMRDVRGDREAAPEPWMSWDRTESRDRLLTMPVKYRLEEGGLPVLVPEFHGQPVLPIGDPSTWSHRQATQPMEAEPETREWYIRRDWAESRGYWDDEEAA